MRSNKLKKRRWEVHSEDHVVLGIVENASRAQAEARAMKLAVEHGLSYVWLLPEVGAATRVFHP